VVYVTTAGHGVRQQSAAQAAAYFKANSTPMANSLLPV